MCWCHKDGFNQRHCFAVSFLRVRLSFSPARSVSLSPSLFVSEQGERLLQTNEQPTAEEVAATATAHTKKKWNGKIKCMYYVLRCVCVNVVPCRSIQVWGLSSIQQITSFNLSSHLGFHAGDCRWAGDIMQQQHIIVSDSLALVWHILILFHSFSIYLSECLLFSHEHTHKID